MGSAALTGKLLRLYILLDPCTIFVLLLLWSLPTDKISTSLVECERVEAKIGIALRADGSPRVWKKFPPAGGQKGFLSKTFPLGSYLYHNLVLEFILEGEIELPREIANKNNFGFQFLCFSNLFLAER